ncbi:MAG: hypothetical protein Fur0025_37890 [Oscillatoriaceae cyanobacterium]
MRSDLIISEQAVLAGDTVKDTPRCRASDIPWLSVAVSGECDKIQVSFFTDGAC